MSTEYTTAADQDLDDVFDPYIMGVHPSPTGVVMYTGQDVYARYAPRIFGQRAPDTGIQVSTNQDLADLFAKKGTAGYLINPANYGQNISVACQSFQWYDTLYCQLALTFNPNGTWQTTNTSTNNDRDTNFNAGPYPWTNYPGGRVVAAGNWSQVANPGIGGNYRVQCSVLSQEFGTVNYDSSGNTIGYSPNFLRGGSFAYMSASSISNPASSAISIANPVTISLPAGGVVTNAKSFQNSHDPAGGVSWYTKAVMNVTLSLSSGAQAVTAQVTLMNIIRWIQGVATGGTTSGGGGGGCLVITNYAGGKPAKLWRKGELIECFDSRTLRSYLVPVEYSQTRYEECYILRTENDIEIECSDSAPLLTLRGLMYPNTMLNQMVPVNDYGEWKISRVVRVESLGRQLVQHISCANGLFLGGKVPGRYFLHHNKISPNLNDGALVNNGF